MSIPKRKIDENSYNQGKPVGCFSLLLAFLLIILGIKVWESDYFQRNVFPEFYWAEKVKYYESERERLILTISSNNEPQTWKENRKERIKDGIKKENMTKEEYDNHKKQMSKVSINAEQMFYKSMQRALEKNRLLLEQARVELSKFR